MRLYVMRHADAVPRGTPGYGQDAQRPLTAGGRLQARDAAKGLKCLSIPIKVILTSPYARAVQTAEEVRRVFGSGTEMTPMEELRAEANPEDTSFALRAFCAFDHLLAVGHEPHCSAWITELVTNSGTMRCLVKKGGVACVELERLPPARGDGTLRWLMTAKQLALIGKSS